MRVRSGIQGRVFFGNVISDISLCKMIEIGKSMENFEEFSSDLDVCNQSWNKLIKNANKVSFGTKNQILVIT